MKISNRIYLVFFVVFALISCKNNKGYTITGEVKNAENMKVYLEDVFAEAPVIIDTTVVLNNTFTINNYSTNGIYRLRFGEDMSNGLFLYLDNKDNIKITVDLNEISGYKATGNAASIAIQDLMNTVKKNFSSLNEIAQETQTASPLSKDSLQTLMSLGKKNHVEYIKKFVEKEPNNDVACFALNFLGPLMQEEIPYLVATTEKLHQASPNSKYITETYNQFQQYRDALVEESEGGVALNAQAPNIILESPNGDSIQLKNLQGNYVLLDFWASWCQPCRMENPNVVALYNQYHAKGFEVFSVSLDANKDQWIKAIAKDKLVWKNHGSDLGGWNSAPAQMYNIKSIPSTFLLDKNGKIIAKNLRGNQLKAKLEELFPEIIN